MIRLLPLLMLLAPAVARPCEPIEDACLACVDHKLVARTQAKVRVTTSENGTIKSAATVTLSKGDTLELTPDQSWSCEWALALPHQTPIDASRPSLQDLSYAKGHKTLFCRAKGFVTVEGEHCAGHIAGCETEPIELMGYLDGHKTRFCKKHGYDGYQPGGRPGYCYRGPACGQRPQVGANEKKFKTK